MMAMCKYTLYLHSDYCLQSQSFHLRKDVIEPGGYRGELRMCIVCDFFTREEIKQAMPLQLGRKAAQRECYQGPRACEWDGLFTV